MDRPLAYNIPSFDFLPPLGVKTPLQPLSPLGQAKPLSSPNEPLSLKQRRRRQKKNRSSDFFALENIEKQNNLNYKIESKNSENRSRNLSSDLLTSGEELLFTPSGFKRPLIETKSVNNPSVQETKKSIIAPNIEPQIPLSQSISSRPPIQSNKPEPSSPSTTEVKAIAQEVYQLLRQRVNIDRERRGASSKPKPFF